MKLTLFQWLACGGLGLILLVELARLRRGGGLWRMRLLRAAVWLAALVAILDPEVTQRLAHLLGISRGADVVFYSFVLAFLAVSFHFYSRHVKMERRLNALVSQLALRDAERGAAGPKDKV